MRNVNDILGKDKLKTKPQNFSSFRERMHEVIFEANDFAGKAFDVVLILMIFASIVVLMLESVPAYYAVYKDAFFYLEFAITVFFLR